MQNNLTKNRLYKTIIGSLSILILGLLYALLIYKTNFYIPCIFNLITGLDCPGCGISHICLSILKFLFLGFEIEYIKIAFLSNPFLFIISPLLLYIFFKELIVWIKTGKTNKNKIDKTLEYITIVLFLLWGILRNLI